MRLNFKHVPALLLSMGLLAVSAPAVADSGQLRDPTRCGQGNANCRNLPPSANDRFRDQRQEPARQKERKVGDKPPLMRTSPLPSEQLLRPPGVPSSTGLDKGSTGLSPNPKKKRVGH